ncbi:aldo/keto reductase [Nicoliella spurrieriana]|uniref:Aldo/keto reductase n=1 Tax=Nicoliella spurrieriana TaxID=2925830 RepID=A0A976X5N8_9LACO|nr:aldo/keto reductase [Nicoliella spurrieriana]UQS86926.1 aldo/keto reductase [Nicoliella spurrieriana]
MKMINFKDAKIPAIGMGTWHMGSDRAAYAQQKATLQYGIEHGATVIDTAEQYGDGDSERLVGDVIKDFDRSQLFVISKFYPFHAERKQMQRALDASLKRLGTDYLDLYLYHWPGSTPLAEVVANMEAMQQSGKVKHWGVSNFDLSDMQDLWSVPGGQHVMANEDLYNIGSRGIDFDLLPWQREHNVPLIAYAPVDEADGRGANLTKQRALVEVAKRHAVTPFQIMLAWAIRDGQTLAIPQTSSEQHMQENIAAGDIELTTDDLQLLDQAFPKPTRHQSLDII